MAGLTDSVQYLKGVGPVRARLLEKLGVRTVHDLIEYYPFRHELRPRSRPIHQLAEGDTATVIGAIRQIRSGRFNGKVTAWLVDGTGRCRVQWFNAPYMLEKLHEGATARLTGKVTLQGQYAGLTNPVTRIIPEGADPFEGDGDSWEPIYPATAQLDSRKIASLVNDVLDPAVAQLVEPLPSDLLRARNLMGRADAVRSMHRPENELAFERARHRLAYEELILLQLALNLGRARQRIQARATPFPLTPRIDERIRRRFPFALSESQNMAVREICHDLNRTEPMNRMLQGDVGAGKTAVAVYAALVAVAHGAQVALLAPTEVLARQHDRKVTAYLEGSRVRVDVLTGSTVASDRQRILAGTASGETNLLIGTHALLERDVRFRRLGLLIIDEQHKFGVAQRAALRGKGGQAHGLVLSATPIPRTLAMTFFGDLDVSVIRGALPGRKEVETRVVDAENDACVWSDVRDRLDRGEQGFVVYPLIDESEQADLRAAVTESRRLADSRLSGYEVGLLHGRMKGDEKRRVMERFLAGDVLVLVSTTVIEVGVDVPNATFMVIQHADRYGLSQLHQLRGRIGRGSKPSCCYLVAQAGGGPAWERLAVLSRTSDGFEIAEEDLRARGPGEFLGTRQHGLPRFKVVDLLEDGDILRAARDDCQEMLRGDPRLQKPEHRNLRMAIKRTFGDLLELVDVA